MREQLLSVIRAHWGFSAFRPLQYEAMMNVLERRDSIVVLPTGGGKSICFQAPALLREGLAVVVSPLISLMKDQVDALTECGVPACRLDSSVDYAEQQRMIELLGQRKIKLLYLSPERLLTAGFLDFLKTLPVAYFAIDEAHCVSMWGHDFRPEYTALSALREHFPQAALHCFTATATAQVQADIRVQLKLRDPQIHRGSFFRPNLNYRVERRHDGLGQIAEIIEKHPAQSGIVYCITRKKTEELAAQLCALGYKAAAYHAGMDSGLRKKVQDDFINERSTVIVATVAFGMGIDKSNVRFVIHSGMPKSLEHYQQESGRGGRDGLEADCVLLWSVGDMVTWQYILEKGNGASDAHQAVAQQKLETMLQYCSSVTCRHRALLHYFDEQLAQENCAACDVCLGKLEVIDDSLTTAQKILSCVVRLKESFGGDYTAAVLTGSNEQRILHNGHGQLSTYGILKQFDKKSVREWLEQLVSQNALYREPDHKTLAVTQLGWQILRGQAPVKLFKIAAKADLKSAIDKQAWEGVDKGLFEHLRFIRKQLADSKKVPAFVIFGDAPLREMARSRPADLEHFRLISGVGEVKSNEYGKLFTEAIRAFCMQQGLDVNLRAIAQRTRQQAQALGKKQSDAKKQAFALFARQIALEEIAQTLGRAQSTVAQYLAEYILLNDLDNPAPWIDQQTFVQIARAAEQHGTGELKPLFDHLEEKVPYDHLRIALACLGPHNP